MATGASPTRRVYLRTLGCPKNQIDSELMLGTLTRAGHEMVLDPSEADVLVVNTCAFIGPAKEESIDAILEAAHYKTARRGQRLVVTGCLAQRYADELQEALPEVDVFVGTGDLGRIGEAVRPPTVDAPRVYRGAAHVLPPHASSPRVRTGAWWTTYLKVSEGCDHQCSFCIIPKIRGGHESRPLEDLVDEAAALAADGVVELNLIAQDLTAYGRDRDDGASLARLVRALARRVPTLGWLRLLYAYPTSVTDELLEVMADEPAVCDYLDMPLQHASDRILRAMRRPGQEATRRLLQRVRAAVPRVALRSAFIVGFPGETGDDVRMLCDFLDEACFEHVGVFRYSQEEGTAAAGLPDGLPADVVEARWEQVMAAQAAVSARRMRAQRGTEVMVLVESREADGTLVGRTERQAPEIDGVIRVHGDAALGTVVPVEVTNSTTYDLEGTIIVPAVDRTPIRP